MSRVSFNDIEWEGEISSVYLGYHKMLPNNGDIFYKVVNDSYEAVVDRAGNITINMPEGFETLSIPEIYEMSNQAMLKLIEIGDKKIDIGECLPMSISNLLGFDDIQPDRFVKEFHEAQEDILQLLGKYHIDDIRFESNILHVLIGNLITPIPRGLNLKEVSVQIYTWENDGEFYGYEAY